MAGCPVTDADVVHLKEFKSLSGVDLTETKVTAVAVAKLKLGMPACRVKSDFTDDQIKAAIEKLKDKE